MTSATNPLLHVASKNMPRSVASAFINSISSHASRPAVQTPDGGSVTYAELGARVSRAVAIFEGLGLSAGDRIAICMPNDIAWPVLTFAAALLRVCVVPINIRYRADELAYALSGSQVKALFTQTSFMSNLVLERLKEIAQGELGVGSAARVTALPRLAHIVMMDDTRPAGTVAYSVLDDAVSALPDLAALAESCDGSEPMWLFWTSGTTSSPKAALMPQSTIEIVWQWTSLVGYSSSDRVLTVRPLFYIAGHFWSLLGPLLHGACVVMATRLTADETVALCRDHKITVLSGNPMMFKRLIEDPTFDPAAFATVRLGYFSGSSLPLADMRAIRAAIGFESLIQTYGMTELGGFIMSTLPSDPIEVACESCGYPFADIELKIVSPECGTELPAGEVGMLLTRGEKLIEYVGLAATEKARFYDADGWYRTGDLMRLLSDGRYQLAGRFKDLIKVSGENVTAAEIEDVLMGHPRISLAAVIARPDFERGEVPVAFIETHGGEPVDLGALRLWCKAQMAPYKVPAEFILTAAPDWPMTATGKVAKHLLAARLVNA